MGLIMYLSSSDWLLYCSISVSLLLSVLWPTAPLTIVYKYLLYLLNWYKSFTNFTIMIGNS